MTSAKHITLITWLGLFCFYPSGSFAQSAKYSNEFLNVGVGARSIGMGKAIIAGSNDVTAGYWNPAGLAGMEGKHQAGLMHAQYFAGIAKFDYLGGVSKIDNKSALGISILRYGVDDIPNTTELIDGDGNLDYGRISSFSVADYAFLISYSRSSSIEGLHVGGSLKIIRRLVGEFADAWGFGIDAAMRYKKGDWIFGAVLRDATSTFNVWQFNEEKLVIEVADSVFNRPPENSLELTLPGLHIGVARQFNLSDNLSLLAEFNTVLKFEGKTAALISSSIISVGPLAGLELSYNDIVFLRSGFGNLQLIDEIGGRKSFAADPSAGLGLHLGRFYLDYAISNIATSAISMYSNIFSVRYVFGD